MNPARVRSLEQMVASEGVVAALFYRLATAQSDGEPLRSGSLPDPARYASFFEAFARLGRPEFVSTPPVLAFIEILLEAAPDDAGRRRIARTALEVLHYTPMIPDAPGLYAQLHAAGHRLDAKTFQGLEAALLSRMDESVSRLASHPEILRHVAVPPFGSGTRHS
jgi:hypothetical protein